MSDDLDAKVKHAPRSPGVYLMKDGTGTVLYVGKARDLRARIRAYFSQTDSRAMIPFLVSRIRNLYIKQIMVKIERGPNAVQIKDQIKRTIDEFQRMQVYRQVRVIVDVDPQ